MCLLPADVVSSLPLPLLLGCPSPLYALPLFDAERAIRDVLGENPPPGTVFEITLGQNLRALLAGQLAPEFEQAVEVPDFPPEEWGEPREEESRG